MKSSSTRHSILQFYLIAHSLGGLVARSYMNEHDHDTGFYQGRRAGERIFKLVTLATPHHGTPIANDDARVSSFWRTQWWSEFEVLDAGLWTVDSTQPNRSDMRWDNYDHRVWDGDYTSATEDNTWLSQIPHTYDSKVAPFYGFT